jgi:ribose transport system ATP-binding protein
MNANPSLPDLGTPLVSMRGISKTFGANSVLRDVDFDIRAGEVHALLGENGAGKSTLMKVLMGVYRPDAGSVSFSGEAITGASVEHHLSQGIAMIFQELSLMPNLTVADNIMMGREPRRPAWILDRQRLRNDAQAVIDRYGFPLRARQLVRELGFAQRQMVEILKAVSRGARVLILDEPTSSLSLREEDTLFRMVDDLKAGGMGLVYISHRMAEIFRLANRISIVKDGQIIGPLDPKSTTVRQVSTLMSKARPAAPHTPPDKAVSLQKPQPLETALEVEDLRTDRKLAGLRFTIGRGEIVGVAGLVGSGRSTLAKALFGLLPDATGTVRVGGRTLRLGDPPAAIRLGLAFVPEDRRLEGLVLNQSLASNIALPTLARLTRHIGLPMVSDRSIADLYSIYRQKLGIVARGPRQLASELSGGNQQKIVFAKWLASAPSLLILDEPTNGVDVNAKADMRAIVRAAADAGVGVLLISSELDELTAAADRILTLVDGRITRELAAVRDEIELRAALQADLAALKQERSA